MLLRLVEACVVSERTTALAVQPNVSVVEAARMSLSAKIVLLLIRTFLASEGASLPAMAYTMPSLIYFHSVSMGVGGQNEAGVTRSLLASRSVASIYPYVSQRRVMNLSLAVVFPNHPIVLLWSLFMKALSMRR